MGTKTLKVKDFTETPGPRFERQGESSGEAFRQKYLAPAFNDAVRNEEVLLVDLDGTAGYATSFLEEAFGGLVREFGGELVRKHLQYRCTDEPYLEEEIGLYISEAATACLSKGAA